MPTSTPAHAAMPWPATPTTRDELAAIGAEQWQAVLHGDALQAFAWVGAAARLGHAPAQAVLGQWLLDGHGAPRDAAQALHWFLLAAHQGHGMAMNMTGRCHEQGWGTAVDAGKAAHWYRAALATPLPEPRYNLANLLAAGDGVARDPAKAFALYREAAEQGYVKAFAKLGRYFEDGEVVEKDGATARDFYRRGAEGGDFRGQFCHAGMLAADGRVTEALQWLEKVPQTATPRYLREAGGLLVALPQPAFQAIGRAMLAKASGG